VDDPALKELFRPNEPITQEELLRGSDGTAYYTAVLRQSPPREFEIHYVEDLEKRGFSMRAIGTSAHAPIGRVEGYEVSLVREAQLEPYTIKYKSAWQGNPDQARSLPHLRNYPYPLEVTGRRIVLSLGAVFLGPWHTAVVIPDHHVVDPPPGLPLPPGAVVTDAVLERGSTSIKWHGQRPEDGWSLRIQFIAKLRPPDAILLMRKTLAGSLGSVTSETPEEFAFNFATVPPWALGAKSGRLSARNILFSSGHGVFVAAAGHAPKKILPGALGGQWQAMSLIHLPPDATPYWLVLYFGPEAALPALQAGPGLERMSH